MTTAAVWEHVLIPNRSLTLIWDWTLEMQLNVVLEDKRTAADQGAQRTGELRLCYKNTTVHCEFSMWGSVFTQRQQLQVPLLGSESTSCKGSFQNPAEGSGLCSCKEAAPTNTKHPLWVVRFCTAFRLTEEPEPHVDWARPPSPFWCSGCADRTWTLSSSKETPDSEHRGQCSSRSRWLRRRWVFMSSSSRSSSPQISQVSMTGTCWHQNLRSLSVQNTADSENHRVKKHNMGSDLFMDFIVSENRTCCWIAGISVTKLCHCFWFLIQRFMRK